MISQETGVLAALNARAFSDITNRAFLEVRHENQKIGNVSAHTSFQRCFDMRSTPVIGSMNTSFATRVSGIQIAQSK